MKRSSAAPRAVRPLLPLDQSWLEVDFFSSRLIDGNFSFSEDGEPFGLDAKFAFSGRNNSDSAWNQSSQSWPHSPPRFSNNSKALRAIASCTDRKSTRLNSSHANISYAVFCLKKKNKK